jgi:FlaA1/EpsC-like NDP-sugar epimerase
VIKAWKHVDHGAIALLTAIIGMNRATKVGALVIIDAVLCVAAVWIAFSVRLGEWILWDAAVAKVIALSLMFWLPIFFWRGIYNSIVRYIGSRTMVGIATSCIMMGLGLGITLAIGAFPGVPRTVAFIQPMVFAVLLVFSRLAARYVLLDLLNQRNSPGRRQGVLIYGAGSAGRQLALSMRHEPNMVLRGYIDDDAKLIGKHLDGVSIHGSDRVDRLIERMEVRTILLALPGISRQQRERIVRKFENISVRVLTLPAMCDLLSGSVSVGDLRAIEITDLLGRDPVPPDELLLHRTIRQFTVMVTGAGGSIGSELCRQIARLDPAQIILVEMTEHALYIIEGELREAQEALGRGHMPAIHAELGNVADADTVRRLFDRWRPDTVFHAAAYKHVPLVEENVIAGMRNNIGGTLNCALEADRIGVQHFILVSTDKAVRPTNVMGASKRVCELILQGLAARGSKTRFAMVRFGNVLGSSGSVVPRFQRQIQQGGPVTLTHREVTRYFMTIPEAAQLVIQAGGMAEGGEVYVLNMGEPIRIYDLARTMIHLSGLTVRETANLDGDIEICEIGLRKGEKLYEELLIGDFPSPTHHLRIMQAREKFIDWKTLIRHLNDLDRFLSRGDRLASLEILSTIVPEFVGVQSIRRSSAA